MLLIVSRDPTRRVQELIASGAVSNELWAADHEADLLAHPYTGGEHLELARLRLTGRDAEREVLRRELGVRGANAVVAAARPSLGSAQERS